MTRAGITLGLVVAIVAFGVLGLAWAASARRRPANSPEAGDLEPGARFVGNLRMHADEAGVDRDRAQPSGFGAAPPEAPQATGGPASHQGPPAEGQGEGWHAQAAAVANRDRFPPDGLGFDRVWRRIEEHEGEEFRQVRGQVFAYRIEDGQLRPSTVNQVLARSQFEKAYQRMPVSGPGQFNDLRGPAYLFAILSDPRIRAESRRREDGPVDARRDAAEPSPSGGVRIPTAEDFRQTLWHEFVLATAAGRRDLLVTAGELHKKLQTGPHAVNRMPTVCNVMHQMKRDGDVVEYAPPQGRGSRLAIRYRLPRPDGAARPTLPARPQATPPGRSPR